MFSREDKYRDTLLAAAGLLGIAAILSPLAWWLLNGLMAAARDTEQFEGSWRTQRDAEGSGAVLWALCILLIGLIAGAVGLALWMTVGGYRMHRKRERAAPPA
jgi:hypothetical protein